MANILGNYGVARAGAWFKQEQEADLQRHRQRLVSEGKILETAGAKLHPKRHKSMEESVVAFEVLSEILQQKARLDDPHAKARQEFIRKVRGMPTPMSKEEILRYQSTIYGVAAAVGHVPRLGLGRDRYHQAFKSASLVPSGAVRQLSPEALELAQRSFMAGLRSLLYGSAIAAVGMTLAGTLALRSAGITSLHDFRLCMQELADPWAQGMRDRLMPLKLRLEGLMRGAEALELLSGEGQGGERRPGETEFSRKLASRLNPKSNPRMRSLNPLDATTMQD